MSAVVGVGSMIWVNSTIFFKFLGAFAEVRKATFSFVTSVPLSARMEQFGSHWTHFRGIWYLPYFCENLSRKSTSIKI